MLLYHSDLSPFVWQNIIYQEIVFWFFTVHSSAPILFGRQYILSVIFRNKKLNEKYKEIMLAMLCITYWFLHSSEHDMVWLLTFIYFVKVWYCSPVQNYNAKREHSNLIHVSYNYFRGRRWLPGVTLYIKHVPNHVVAWYRSDAMMKPYFYNLDWLANFCTFSRKMACFKIPRPY